MRRPLQLAFVGGGENSVVGRTHFIASQADRCFEVVAGMFSRHAAASKLTADIWGIDPLRTYRSVSDLLAAECDDIDAVAILTPTPDHYELIAKVLAHKLPVISEKAMVCSSNDAKKICDLSARKNVGVYNIYNYTGYPMLREMRAWVLSGKLGEITHVKCDMPQEGFTKITENGRPATPQSWRTRDGELPTLTLDLGIHLHNLIKFAAGVEPTSVVASASIHGRFFDVIDTVFALAKTDQGADIAISYGKTSLGKRNGLSLEIFGELGSLSWVQEDPERIVYAGHKGDIKLIDRGDPDTFVAHLARYQRFKPGHPAGFIEAFSNHYADIATSLVTGESEYSQEYTFGALDALQGLNFLEALHKSAQTRTWQSVDTSDESSI